MGCKAGLGYFCIGTDCKAQSPHVVGGDVDIKGDGVPGGVGHSGNAPLHVLVSIRGIGTAADPMAPIGPGQASGIHGARTTGVQTVLVVILAGKIREIISGRGGVKVTMAGDMFTKQRDEQGREQVHFLSVSPDRALTTHATTCL